MTEEDKTMLALAAITYRGFANRDETQVAELLRPWLKKLEDKSLGTWELVWGPATYHPPAFFFDDAMVYVAQHQDVIPSEPPRYAIAIRGTNPISSTDWIFGDFWNRLLIEWQEGVPDAMLSGSTALGMEIMKILDAEPPTSSGLATIDNFVKSTLKHLDFRELLSAPESFHQGWLKDRLKAITAHAKPPDRLAFDTLVRHIRATATSDKTLPAFLSQLVPRSRISVSGHSKGGALCVALALWIAENYDLDVDCFSFAGPTVGNAAFVERYNRRLKSRTRRIMNPRDVVPHAWIPEDLRMVGKIYPVLSDELALVASAVSKCDYKHVGSVPVTIPSNDTNKPLVLELIYHHLDAYLEAAEFTGKDWDAQSIFLGK